MSVRDPGSFRDPSGYVFSRDNRIFRAIDSDCADVLRQLEEAPILRKLVSDGQLVGTEFVTEDTFRSQLMSEHSGYEQFLEHQKLDVITYPYEWTLSMLADAGCLTLDLQMRLIESGYSLKDATAYNIQFVGARPIFIDVSSIERPKRLDIWFALGQFCRMFLYPLILFRHRGWDFRSYFLAAMDGRDAEQVVKAFGPVERWRPRLLLDVTLPALLGKWAQRKTNNSHAVFEKSDTKPTAQIANLRRLHRKITKLARRYRTSGVWSDYARNCSYDPSAEMAKKKLVRDFLATASPPVVLDLGCNTGDYSFLAADAGAKVLAVDGDHDAVETLYRRLQDQPADITPMLVDLANPSPAIGFRNQERASLLSRLRADCVFALALIHHLLVSANLPLTAIRDLFFDMTREYLILEFVPTDDVMFEQLLQFRVNLFEFLTLDVCRQVFQERFTLVREEPIPDSTRTLFLWKKLR